MAEDIREKVRQRYAAAANVAASKSQASCCSTSCCGGDALDAAKDYISSDLYSRAEQEGLPLEALLASLGCGNPTALAELKAGETVLDLGSGGGIDVLLSARRVGPTGFAYGLDMTDEMLALAEHNRVSAGVANVEFLKGEIENIPLPDSSIDVIISNCVINLSGDKQQVLREAFRVLKPAGRLAVADMVIDGKLPDEIGNDILAWSGCVAGALAVEEYQSILADTGFTAVEIVALRKHGSSEIAAALPDVIAKLSEDQRQGLHGKLWSAFIRASKPLAG